MAEPGDTEKEIAQNMIELCLEYGADSVAFMTMGAGRNIFETHHIPGSYRIREGDFIHVDFGCYFDGYLSDISRTAVVNKPDRDQLQAYEFAVSAERAVGEALIPGSTVMEVHEATERFYMDRGHKYKRAFVGHGLGIGCHEYPFLGPSHGDWFIEPGMFFQVEPSIVMEGTRVHTENSYLVTQSGGQNVSEYRDLTDIQVIR
jgi:Xaa-Pro aminopeptidase